MPEETKIYDNKNIKERLEQEGREPWDPSAIEATEEEIQREINKLPSGTGLLHTKGEWNGIEFKKADNETVYPLEQSPAQIVFGTDRPDSFLSGFGARGSNRAASIDLVVGRMSSVREGKGPKRGKDGIVRVDNSFAADAARIYISQLTNIDKDFHIDRGRSGVMKGRSGIGIKADGVRIIGREGVKIVTGRMSAVRFGGKDGETNSLGGKLPRAPTIELIAGNFSGTRRILGGIFNPSEKQELLQGIAKGQNTRKALRDLAEIFDEMWSELYSFVIAQLALNAAIGVAYIDSLTIAGQAVASTATTVAALQTIFCMSPMTHTRNNRNVWEANFLTRGGTWFIESTNVFAT